jgi:hypothetical protein
MQCILLFITCAINIIYQWKNLLKSNGESSFCVFYLDPLYSFPSSFYILVSFPHFIVKKSKLIYVFILDMAQC